MDNRQWIDTRQFLPQPGIYWIKLDGIPQLAELKKSWWRDKWFREGIRVYPKQWANV